MNLLNVAMLAAVVLLTSFISGILGMAGGMILMGVLLAMLPVPAAMMLHGITQMASNGWRAWLWRRHIDWRVMSGYVLGALAAISVFFGIAIVVSKPIAYILLGLTPYASHLLPQRLALNVDRPRQPFLCGAVCTSVQMLAGVAGPLLDVFFVRSQLDRRGVVATKAMSQAFGHLLKVIFFGTMSYTAVGRVGDGLSMTLVVICIACAFMGTTLSKSVLERMTDANFRQWTKWTVFAVGTAYLLWGTWLLLRQG